MASSVPAPGPTAELALGPLLGCLSQATDLAAGVPPETSLKTCVAAVELARAAGVSGAALSDVFTTALLRHLGCTAFAHEAARLGAGEDQALLGAFEGVDARSRAQVLGVALTRAGAGKSAGDRLRTAARVLTTPSAAARLAAAHCDLAVTLARGLGLRPGVIEALGQIYERHDGRGHPRGVAGDALALPARVLHLAMVTVVQALRDGPAAALRAVRARRGKQLDPALADVLLADPRRVLALAAAPSVWDDFAALEPEPRLTAPAARLDDIALAFARYVDVKSVYTIGHSPGVAELAAAAARAGGATDDEVALVRRAALLHDLGAVSVPNGIWDKPGALNPAEWERVRLHAYHTERILARSPVLAPLAPIAGGHHERPDGRGYHRGAAGAATPRLARVLAAADAYRALREDRAHRPARSAADAAAVVREAAAAGALDRDAVALVLGAAGHDARRALPAGLTEREAEVLCLVARGLTDKEIGRTLGISPRTVHHHVEHIYAKTGVATRAAAALFAVTHELVAAGMGHRAHGAG